ncbi:putative F-box-like domain superfamily protein [Helianthus anomalus]
MRSRSSNMDQENNKFVEDFFGSIPEGFVAKALSLTSPGDAFRLSLVCSVFRSAAEWDASFLPPDYHKIVTQDENAGCSSFGSKKDLYPRLCDHPHIIDGGNKVGC